MNTVFLSYSRQDYFFAEILSLKLEAAGYKLWRDQGAVRAGEDWRRSIEDGIAESIAVIAALSANSAESPYVTYEWAYASGMGKTVVPVMLSDCKIHPKLEPTEYIDFSYPKVLPWAALLARLAQIEVEAALVDEEPAGAAPALAGRDSLDLAAKGILTWLSSRGFTMASFERLREKVDTNLSDDIFKNIIATHPRTFRRAIMKGGKPGIAKRSP